MESIILDSSVLIRYPKLLATRNPHIELLIPSEVLSEMAKAPFVQKVFNDRAKLIELAQREGVVKVLPPQPVVTATTMLADAGLGADADSILFYATEKLDQQQPVKVATLDKKLSSVLRRLGIEILPPEELKAVLSKFAIATSPGRNRFLEGTKWALRWFESSYLWFLPQSLKRRIQRRMESLEAQVILFERKEFASLLWQLTISAVVLIVGALVLKNMHTIVRTINVWGTIVLIFFIGIGLFVLREKQRFSYGLAEFAFGVITIIKLFMPSDFSYEAMQFNLDNDIRLIGGLYIMVRGQDNILKAIKGTRFGSYLKARWNLGA